jgi:hypothetical protein
MKNVTAIVVTLLICGTYLVGKFIDEINNYEISMQPVQDGVILVRHDSKEVHFCNKGVGRDGDIYPVCKSGARGLR